MRHTLGVLIGVALLLAPPAAQASRSSARRSCGALPSDGCTQFEAWVDAGGVDPLFPQVDLAPATRVFASGAASNGNAAIQRAAMRPMRLGQTSRRAKRFTVEGMPADHLRIAQSLVATYATPGSQA